MRSMPVKENIHRKDCSLDDHILNDSTPTSQPNEKRNPLALNDIEVWRQDYWPEKPRRNPELSAAGSQAVESLGLAI